jgi:malate synthase
MSGLDRVSVGNLKVAKVLHDFILEEVMPGTGIDSATFWRGLDRIVHDFAPRNRALLKRRDELQAKIDAWYRARRGQPSDVAAQKAFLVEIGYLVPECQLCHARPALEAQQKVEFSQIRNPRS